MRMTEIKAMRIRIMMLCLEANIDGMKADNYEREKQGLALAWPGEMFFEAQRQLESLASELKEIEK